MNRNSYMSNNTMSDKNIPLHEKINMLSKTVHQQFIRASKLKASAEEIYQRVAKRTENSRKMLESIKQMEINCSINDDYLTAEENELTTDLRNNTTDAGNLTASVINNTTDADKSTKIGFFERICNLFKKSSSRSVSSPTLAKR